MRLKKKSTITWSQTHRSNRRTAAVRTAAVGPAAGTTAAGAAFVRPVAAAAALAAALEGRRRCRGDEARAIVVAPAAAVHCRDREDPACPALHLF